MSETTKHESGTVLAVACFMIIAIYGLMIDLKGVGTDEGLRLGIINGGQPYALTEVATQANWTQVLEANSPYAYQPLYFLLQNTVMRVAQTHNVIVLRTVNLFLLWLCLQGLLALSKEWSLLPRLFLLGIFSFNAYLLMHALQIREYILGVAFYVWSTWLVLRLDTRKLERNWADVAWFAAYGVLLALGFYTQSWVVFPAIGQGLFLLVRRGHDKWRFYAHLALAYLIVLSATEPYLRSNNQKVNIGHWGFAGTNLWSQLSDGFHLVLTGHAAGHSPFTSFVFWFWLVLIAGAGLLLPRGKSNPTPAVPPGEFRRQGFLMLLSMAVPLAFQITYFYRVDNLSVWPRYFVIHYFFLTWLIALGFKLIWDLNSAPAASAWQRRSLKAALGLALALLLVSGVYQTRSYYQNPYMDSGLSAEDNWRTISAALSRVVEPGDVIITQDIIHSWTLTFTRPMPNQVVPAKKIADVKFDGVDRLVYLESSSGQSARDELTIRLAALGFPSMHESVLTAADGASAVPNWQVLIFKRR